jgi:hypothetical protein
MVLFSIIINYKEQRLLPQSAQERRPPPAVPLFHHSNWSEIPNLLRGRDVSSVKTYLRAFGSQSGMDHLIDADQRRCVYVNRFNTIYPPCDGFYRICCFCLIAQSDLYCNMDIAVFGVNL